MGAAPKILVTVHGENGPETFSNESDSVLIGRSKKAQVKIAMEGISREHLTLIAKNGELFVQDMGSANGTLLNGKKITANTPHKFKPSDKIEIRGLPMHITSKLQQEKQKNENPKELRKQVESSQVDIDRSRLLELAIDEDKAEDSIDLDQEITLPNSVISETKGEREIKNQILNSGESEKLIEQRIRKKFEQKWQEAKDQIKAKAKNEIGQQLEQEFQAKWQQETSALKEQYEIKFNSELTIAIEEKRREIEEKINTDYQNKWNGEYQQKLDLEVQSKLEVEVNRQLEKLIPMVEKDLKGKLEKQFKEETRIWQEEKEREITRQIRLQLDKDYGQREIEMFSQVEEKIKQRLLVERQKMVQEFQQQIQVKKQEVELEVNKLLHTSKLNAEKHEAAVREKMRLEEMNFHEMAKSKKEALFNEELRFKEHLQKQYDSIKEKAKQEYDSIVSKARSEAENLLSSAKNEWQELKGQIKLEEKNWQGDYEKKIKWSEEQGQLLLEQAKNEAKKIYEEASTFENKAKSEAERILKNAYATAVAMATGVKYGDAQVGSSEMETTSPINLKRAFPELNLPEFEAIEKLHETGLDYLVKQKQSTLADFEEISKKKQMAMQLEEKALRDGLYQRIMLEANEQALHIKEQAEKSAAGILAEAYTLSKRLTAETQSHYQKEKTQYEFELKGLEEKKELAQLDLHKVHHRIREAEQKIAALEIDSAHLEKRKVKLDAELLNLQNGMKDFESRTAERKMAAETEWQALNQKVNKIKEEKVSLESAFLVGQKQSNEVLLQLRDQISAHKNQQLMMERQIDALSHEIKRREEQSHELQNEIEHHKDKKRQSELDLERIAQKIADSEAQLQNLEGREKELERSILRLERDRDNLVNNIEEERARLLGQTQVNYDESERIKNEALQFAEQTRAEVHAEISKQKQDSIEEISRDKQTWENVKANEQQQFRTELEQKRHSIINEAKNYAEKEKDKLISEGKNAKELMLAKVREMQARIEAKNKELDQKEAEVIKFESETMERAKKEADKIMDGALLESVKAREQFITSFESEKQNLLDDLAKQKMEAEQQASYLIEQAKREREMALGEAKKEAQIYLDKVKSEVQVRQAKIDEEIQKYKEGQERELAQIKIKELATLKERETEFQRRWNLIRDEAVNILAGDLKVKLGISWQEKISAGMAKLAPNLVTQVEEVKDNFMANLLPSVKNSLYPPEEYGSKSKAVLVGNGKVASSVKKFWIKIAIGVSVPLILLIINLISPGIYGRLYDSTFGTLTPGEKLGDKVARENLEKIRNRPKYNPAPKDGFQETYWENIVFTKSYRDVVVNPTFIEAWTKDCNRYLIHDLRLGDEAIINLISHENNMHQLLIDQFKKINPDFVNEGHTRLQEIEAEYGPKIKELFPDNEKYQQFWSFKRNYFLNGHDQYLPQN